MLVVKIMIKIFINSFSFKKIFQNGNAPWKHIIAYFLLIVLITSFPLNYQIFQNDGWRGLNSITIGIREVAPPWFPNELPNDVAISKNGLYTPIEKAYYYEATLADDTRYQFVINPQGASDEGGFAPIYTEEGIITKDVSGVVVMTPYQKAIVLCKDKILYYDNSKKPIVGNYDHIEEVIHFTELKNMDKYTALTLLLDAIDGGFNQYMVFSSILINTLTQLFMNLIMIVIIAAIFLLIRIKYKKVTNYRQNIGILISAMTIPSILSFIIGILGVIEINSFGVVLFQLLTPLIAIGAIYLGSGEKDIGIKYTA
jgi:hypothetical protein